MYPYFSAILISLFFLNNGFSQQIPDSTQVAEYYKMDTLGFAKSHAALDLIYDFPDCDCSISGSNVIYLYSYYSPSTPTEKYNGKEYLKHKVITIQRDSIFSLNVFESFDKKEIIPTNGWIDLIRKINDLDLGNMPLSQWEKPFAIIASPDGISSYLKFCHQQQEKIISLSRLELVTTDDPNLLPIFLESANYKGQVMEIFNFFEDLEK